MTRRHPFNDAVESALARIEALATFAPIGLDEHEQSLWRDCDLASLAEHRLGDTTDPEPGVDPDLRSDWMARAGGSYACLPHLREYARCFWIVDGATRVGTLALATTSLGSPFVLASSLYVMPRHRGRRFGTDALHRAHAALLAHGLALRLGTHWTWGRNVRLYLGLGMFVRHWKRELAFVWDPGGWRPRIVVGETRATLAVARGDEHVSLATAGRDGERLLLEDEPGAPTRDIDLLWSAKTTFAVALASAGWPLLRSAEHWEECRYADLGHPEALADRIRVTEAWDRHHGWRVDAPRIPGLRYPTWEELAQP